MPHSPQKSKADRSDAKLEKTRTRALDTNEETNRKRRLKEGEEEKEKKGEEMKRRNEERERECWRGWGLRAVIDGRMGERR